MKTYCPQTIERLQSLGKSKGEYFKEYPDAFDYALPQAWLNAFADWCAKYRPTVTYDMIRSTTVYAYGDTYSGPVTCCNEVCFAYAHYSK